MKSVLNRHWKDWCWGWSSNTLATWCEEPTHWKRPGYWERLKVGGEGDDRGWDGWMASLTWWTWVWVGSRSWWWTGKPGMLQSIGSQRVRHDLVTELNQIIPTSKKYLYSFQSPDSGHSRKIILNTLIVFSYSNYINTLIWTAAKVLGFCTPICEMISWDSLLCAFASCLLNHLGTLLTTFGMSSVFGDWMLLDSKLCYQQNGT